jgi:hypothetical protein
VEPWAARWDGCCFLDDLLKSNFRISTRSFRGGTEAAALVVPTTGQHALPR